MLKSLSLKILLVITICSNAYADDGEFNEFVDSYLNNPSIALTRTLFPLRYVTEYVGATENETVVKEITKVEFEKWPLITGEKVPGWEDWKVLSIDEKKPCEYTSCKYVTYGIPNTGINSRYLFVKKEDLWFLSEMYDLEL